MSSFRNLNNKKIKQIKLDYINNINFTKNNINQTILIKNKNKNMKNKNNKLIEENNKLKQLINDIKKINEKKIKKLNNYKRYIITNNLAGGSFKWINDLNDIKIVSIKKRTTFRSIK